MEIRLMAAWLRDKEEGGRISQWATPVIIEADGKEGYASDPDWYVAPEVFAVQIPNMQGETPA